MRVIVVALGCYILMKNWIGNVVVSHGSSWQGGVGRWFKMLNVADGRSSCGSFSVVSTLISAIVGLFGSVHLEIQHRHRICSMAYIFQSVDVHRSNFEHIANG